MEDSARVVSPVDGTFQHERAQAYVLPHPSVYYSAICNLCSSSTTPFRGLALTVLHMCDVRTHEGEVRFRMTCSLFPVSSHNYYQLQTLEVIVRSVRSINTMAGIRSFTIAVACGVEDYPQVVNALGTDTIELYYIYSKDTKKNSKKSCAYSICQLHEGVSVLHTGGGCSN